MTEAEWLASSDPAAMLRAVEDKVSNRKLRLFAAACYRDVAEAARGIANADRAADEAEWWAEKGNAQPGVRERSNPMNIHDRAIDHATGAASWAHYHRGRRTPEQLNAHQASLLREIVGNPWRTVTLPSGQVRCRYCRGMGSLRDFTVYDSRWSMVKCSWCGGKGKVAGQCPWLTHNDGAVPKIARVIYENRAWDMMPMLADALEEAGCDNEEMLRHCRGEEVCWCCGGDGNKVLCTNCDTGWIPLRGPHCRGCWVLDLLLGKE